MTNAFQQAFCVSLSNALPEGTEIESREFKKNNGTVHLGIHLKSAGRGISPIIYPEEFFDAYKAGASMESIAESAAKILLSPVKDISEKLMGSFDKIRDRIVFRLVGRQYNEELLERAVHRDYLDLAVTYGIYVDDFENSSGVALLLKDMADSFPVSESEIYELALRNTPRLLGDSLQGMNRILFDREDAEEKMFVLTNKKAFYGASALLYSNGIRELADRFESDLYILPSSIHELILLPYDPEVTDSVREIVRYTNATDLRREDLLSDSVYRYERSTGSVSICTPA